jgi:hypothetical protein
VPALSADRRYGTQAWHLYFRSSARGAESRPSASGADWMRGKNTI